MTLTPNYGFAKFDPFEDNWDEGYNDTMAKLDTILKTVSTGVDPSTTFYDGVNGSYYKLTVVDGQIVVQETAYLALADSVTGDKYKISIVAGQINVTPVAAALATVDSINLKDDSTGQDHLLTISNGALNLS